MIDRSNDATGLVVLAARYVLFCFVVVSLFLLCYEEKRLGVSNARAKGYRNATKIFLWILMGFRLYVVVTAAAVLTIVDSGNGQTQNHRKYGCLIAPDICTPPEDCSDDGFGGNCQVPPIKNYYSVEDQLSMLKLMLEDVATKDYAIDYEALQDAFYDYFYSRGTLQDTPEYASKYDLSALTKYKRILDFLQKSVNDYKHSYSNGVQDYNLRHQEYKRSSENPVFDARKRHMKELVEQTLKVLADNDYTFSELDNDEKQMIVTYLAKKLAKDMENQKKAATVFSEKPELMDSVKPTKENVDSVGLNNDSPNQETNFEVQEVSKDNIQEKPQVSEDFIKDTTNTDKSSDRDDSKSFAALDAIPSPKAAHKPKSQNQTLYTVIIVVGATVLLIILVTIISCVVYAYRSKKQQNKKFIGSVADDENEFVGDDYQELCRQHYATKHSEQTENHQDILSDTAAIQEPLITRTYPVTQPNDSEPRRQMSGNPTRNSSLSSTSWSEEPVTASLDITTGHAVLSYMEDHLNNKDRLDEEWEEICGYEADNTTTNAALSPQNSRKNRSVTALPYDHNRIKLNASNNHLQSDYINASAIIDNDPKRPLYIAAQGPLPSTIPDFWQMMWEQGCVAVVMLSPLVEEGINQCARYWPDEGSCTYHNFEIHLVSEHIWCEDYLVRSLYLKHLDLGETRTVTQFHFLSWPRDRVPSTPKPLLELRRKVTKCYKGHNSPVLVHCSDGVGRTGTYILLDLAIDRMLKGAKEIDIAATLEHIRDQRMGMVGTKEQFEFALTAVAEEVNAILKSLSH